MDSSVSPKDEIRFLRVCHHISTGLYPFFFFFFFFFLFFQTLNFLLQGFGLLNDLFPFPSILDAGYSVFDLHLADVLFDVTSHLYLGLPCDLLVTGFQLNIFLTVLVSSILCT
jgi:hypothetical protein